MLESDFPTVDLPEEFSLYEQKVKQLNVGRTGKVGSLVITLERDSRTNRTVATELYHKVPLQVQKPLYVEESFPEMGYVYIMSPSGGILQGDRLRIDVTLKNNAQAHITTQAATKVYRMNSNYAAQTVNISVGDNCYLEYIPDQLIPYRNSRFYQCVNMQVHDNATAVYSEIVTPGRVASDEKFEYDICYLKTIATDQNSSIRFMDAMMLQPKKQKLFGLESKQVFANMYVLTRKIEPDTLSNTIHNILKDVIEGSASVLPRDDGVFARIVGDTTDEIKGAIDMIVNEIRNTVLNKPFSGTRKY